MTGSLPFTIVFAAAAAFSLYELARPAARVRSYLADREAHAAHVLMNASMAAMAAPFWGLAAERVTFWVLVGGTGVLAARFAAALARGRAAEAGGSAYHALAMAAMIYALLLMPAAGAMDPSMAGDMAGHAMHHAAPQRTPVAAILAAIFAIDAAATVVFAFAMPGRLIDPDAPDYAAQRTELRRSAIPHVIMDAGMIAMLV
ncbi:DUF5134 domain-containing protein [Croceicoccus sp. BE223]|uniref:DUF5134 domain-containing protein n=1 Tax=Croceicoccus sp. BE223 TaxID=2817716 RepID=UPI002859390B|nr:DUF5134 domain-containing protein [Croceicoccus sp. BE223]MDR7102359.1 hypothetical protein [Croceicoccus sp. BE223]